MKNLTSNSVKFATLLLIETNGKTTTLDVKTHLRSLGFYADQQAVSDLMIEAGDQLPLEFDDNGKHRTYRLPSPSALAAALAAAPVASTTTPLSNSNALYNLTVSYAKRNGVHIQGSDQEVGFNVGDWIVTDEDGDNARYFSGYYKRDDVRQATANSVSIHFGTTRAKRIRA